ncbi:MAG: hypothetical protein Q9163_004637 [Psora crenata]
MLKLDHFRRLRRTRSSVQGSTASTWHEEQYKKSRFRQIFSSKARLRRCPSPIRQSSPFLHIPPELMLIIFDFLSLPARVALSQTCRGLRGNYGSQCHAELRKFNAQERIQFLGELSDLLPEFRACYYCSALHEIDTEDTPSTFRACLRSKRPSLEPARGCHSLNRSYSIAIRHVQLALKYTRLKNVHEKYRASLLATYKVNHTNYSSSNMTFIAEPKVEQGRFFLKTIWQFSGNATSLSPSDIDRVPFAICPHLRSSALGRGPLFVALSDLYDLRQAKLEWPNDVSCASREGSCIKCPTDYTMDVAKSGKEVFIHVWQDLGTGTSPDDPYWKSYILDGYHNSPYVGEAFDYEHGSIRRALTNESANWKNY